MQTLSGIFDEIQGFLVHLGSASLVTIGLIIAAIALIGFFLLRR